MENRTVPRLGQDLLYCLTKLDAEQITDRRQRAAQAAVEWPHTIGPTGADVAEGDLYPATVVRLVSLDPEDGLNLQVALDGTDTHWVQRAIEGTEPGTWCWPDI
jgi:hypothetical protein